MTCPVVGAQPPVASNPSQRQSADEEDEEAQDTKMRWSAKTCSTRLLHVIVELRGDFVRRDTPFDDRNSLDSAARNWFWQGASLLFNKPSFLRKPVPGEPDPPKPETYRFQSDDNQNNQLYKCLNPMYTGFPADADKLEEVFKELRKDIMTALNRYASRCLIPTLQSMFQC